MQRSQTSLLHVQSWSSKLLPYLKHKNRFQIKIGMHGVVIRSQNQSLPEKMCNVHEIQHTGKATYTTEQSWKEIKYKGRGVLQEAYAWKIFLVLYNELQAAQSDLLFGVANIAELTKGTEVHIITHCIWVSSSKIILFLISSIISNRVMEMRFRFLNVNRVHPVYSEYRARMQRSSVLTDGCYLCAI